MRRKHRLEKAAKLLRDAPKLDLIPDREPDREAKITFEQFDELGGPDGLTRHLKDLGFRFDRDTCPVRLAEPRKLIHDHNGTTFQQWDLS